MLQLYRKSLYARSWKRQIYGSKTTETIHPQHYPTEWLESDCKMYIIMSFLELSQTIIFQTINLVIIFSISRPI